jgi:hypothetical protein
MNSHEQASAVSAVFQVRRGNPTDDCQSEIRGWLVSGDGYALVLLASWSHAIATAASPTKRHEHGDCQPARYAAARCPREAMPRAG